MPWSPVLYDTVEVYFFNWRLEAMCYGGDVVYMMPDASH